MATITTKACISCGNTSTLELNEQEVAALNGGAAVQDALPTRSTDERELVITGIHGDCWDEMFG